MVFLLVVVGLALGWLVWWYSHQQHTANVVLPATYPQLLATHVGYYRSLSDEKKAQFADRVGQFLARVRVEGVGTTVDDLDKVLVASSAIIPVFGFEGWDYYRLTTVLLYDGAFSRDFDPDSADRNVLGMVGEGGALQSTMVLAKPALHAGFANESGKSNTGIHEFVHLLDQADGAVDGLPQALLTQHHAEPWLRLIHRSIREIQANASDIDPYGLTNEAEFFAVVAEYFFKRPDLLHQKHPALFARLEEIFRQNPLNADHQPDPADQTPVDD